MAFRDAYEALNGGNEYTVSIGKDATERGHVIEAAIIDNKLTVHQAIGMGLDLTDDALRHAAKSGQLTWSQAGQLRIDNNFNVLAIESSGGDTAGKEAAVKAITSFINKKQYV
jgi:polyphosphate kinase 2 (PPK2 family)